MKKGILVVSFGTSFKDTRKKCIDTVENEIQNAYPGYIVRRAFTSRMIMKKLRERDGIIIDSPEEALDRMVEEGFQSIIVQPLHIIPGFEYDKVKKAVVSLKHRMDIDIEVGKPLLYAEDHYDQVVEVLTKDLPQARKGYGTLYMGHGTEHFANACYSMLQNKLNEKRQDILIANVEGYPELENVENDIIGIFSKMTLMPLMLVAGDHARNDMAGDDDSFRSHLEDKGITVECQMKGLGENPDIRKIFVSRVGELVG